MKNHALAKQVQKRGGKVFHLCSKTDSSGSIIQICLAAQHHIVYCLSASQSGDYPGRLIKTLQKEKGTKTV